MLAELAWHRGITAPIWDDFMMRYLLLVHFFKTSGDYTFSKGKNYLVIISGTESGGVELGLSKKRGFEKVD